SIAGSLVSVVPRDPNNHVSFVFDLATRQWVSSTSSLSPAPHVYITPTPDAPLLPPGTYEAVNDAAGTATRIARLTQVPTWPPGQPRSYPSAEPSTPFSPIPTRIAGIGMIVESGMVGDLSVAYGVYINQWREEADGQRIDVYAGAKSESNQSDQGVVVVRVIASN